MLAMVSYPRRPQSGHITCYLNRTFHVLPTDRRVPVDVKAKIAYASSNPRPSPGVSAVPQALPSSIAFTEGHVGVSTRRPAMAGKSLLLSLILCVSAIGARAAAREEIVPAGTILHCTM